VTDKLRRSSFRFSDSEKDVLSKTRWFVIVAAAATFLHFATDRLEQWGIPSLIILLLRYIEQMMFICDILIFVLFLIVSTIVAVREIFLILGLDIFHGLSRVSDRVRRINRRSLTGGG
jgi:hypothetical protein